MASCSPVLFTLRKLANGEFPVRIQVYVNGKQFFLLTGLAASKTAFACSAKIHLTS